MSGSTDISKLLRTVDRPTAIDEAIATAMRGEYVVAVQWIGDDGQFHQNVYRNISANRLQQSADEFRKAQLDEAMRVEIREQVKTVLREQGLMRIE